MVSNVLWWDGRRQLEDTELLVSAATMLVDATTYPGVFDECAEELARLVRVKSCSQDELMDLADMLLIWVMESYHIYRYCVSLFRVSEILVCAILLLG